MAKLGLLFIAVFCAVQLSMASRLPRETAESTTEIFDDLKQKLSQGLADLQKKAQETFTKENAQKVLDQIQEVGNKLVEDSKQFGESVSKAVSDLATEAEKKANDAKN